MKLSQLAKKRRQLKQLREKAVRKEFLRLREKYRKEIAELIGEARESGHFGSLFSGIWLFGITDASDISQAFSGSQVDLSAEFESISGVTGPFASRTTVLLQKRRSHGKVNIWKPGVGLEEQK